MSINNTQGDMVKSAIVKIPFVFKNQYSHLQTSEEAQAFLIPSINYFILAGVAQQYSGAAGRRENSHIGVFLLYASYQGAAFLDRALYLPKEWVSNRVRCCEAEIADEVTFATKGELAKRMLARAFAAGVRARWMAGDHLPLSVAQVRRLIQLL